MTELSKKEKSALVHKDAPHYFHVDLVDHPNGLKQVHCGSERDLQSVLRMNPGASWKKVYLPHAPDTVDVMYVETGKEQVLQAQQILEPSNAKPFNAST